MRPDAEAVERVVRMALAEDVPWGDLTTESLVAQGAAVEARLMARGDGVLCGEDVLPRQCVSAETCALPSVFMMVRRSGRAMSWRGSAGRHGRC